MWAQFVQPKLQRSIRVLNLSTHKCTATQFYPCVHPIVPLVTKNVTYTTPRFSWPCSHYVLSSSNLEIESIDEAWSKIMSFRDPRSFDVAICALQHVEDAGLKRVMLDDFVKTHLEYVVDVRDWVPLDPSSPVFSFYRNLPVVNERERIHADAGLHGGNWTDLRVNGLPRCTPTDSSRDLIITASSLVKLAPFAPELRALVLSNCKLLTDHYIPSLGDYSSAVQFIYLPELKFVTVTPLDAIKALMEHCKLMEFADLSGCDWVDHAILEYILRHNTIIRILNLVGCPGIPPAVGRLYYFGTPMQLNRCLSMQMKIKDLNVARVLGTWN
jgi:hypothetical protein